MSPFLSRLSFFCSWSKFPQTPTEKRNWAENNSVIKHASKLAQISGLEEEGWPFRNTQNSNSILSHATKSGADEDTNCTMNINASFPPPHLPRSFKLYVLRAGTTSAQKCILLANPAVQTPSRHLSIFKIQALTAPGKKKQKFCAKIIENLVVIISKFYFF